MLSLRTFSLWPPTSPRGSAVPETDQIPSKSLPFFRLLRTVLPPRVRKRLQTASAEKSVRLALRAVEMSKWAQFWAGLRDR